MKFKHVVISLTVVAGCGFYAHQSDASAAESAGKSTTLTSVHSKQGTALSALGKKCLPQAKELYKAGFKSDSELTQSIATDMAETHCVNKSSTPNKDSSVDDCYMQINRSAHPGLLAKKGCASAAYAVRHDATKRGWNNWSSHNNKTDLKFIPQARLVAKEVKS